MKQSHLKLSHIQKWKFSVLGKYFTNCATCPLNLVSTQIEIKVTRDWMWVMHIFDPYIWVVEAGGSQKMEKKIHKQIKLNLNFCLRPTFIIALGDN